MRDEHGLRLPDFIVGGAPRSGTTWLYHLLDRHPAIEMAKPVRPEPKFFLVDEIYRRGLAHYSENWFSAIPDAMLAGEKSTNYLESDQAAERISRDLPNVQLIFALREPVDRAVSNWRWSRQNGMETLSFDEALLQEEQRELEYTDEWRISRPFSYFSRGLYYRLLLPYVERFGLDRILVLKYEDIGAAPGRVAEAAHQFLGVDLRPEDAQSLGSINASSHEEVEPATLADLRSRYLEPNRQLAGLLGPRFEIWPHPS